MGILLRAVVTGFGLSLGASLYKRIEKRLGLADEAGRDAAKPPSVSPGNPVPGMPGTPGEPEPLA
jgi:hypothetical protein